MDDDRKNDDLDLTEADRIVIGLYEKGRGPIPWDKSDDAILSLSREIHRSETVSDRQRDDSDLTEADRIVMGLYETGRNPVPWDESDDAILSLSREVLRDRSEADSERRQDDLDLTEADRVVMGLYEAGRTPIPWDDSDDAILSLSRDIRDDGAGRGGDNVVSLSERRRSLVSRVIHSPATGFAMAASLLVGVFVGQGLPPVWEFGGEKVLTRGISVENGAPPAESPAPTAPSVALSSDTLEGLDRAMSGFECADLEARIANSRRIAVTGFVSSPADLRKLSETLGRMQGIQVINRAEVREWPSCAALQLLHRAGGATLPTERLPVVRPHDHGSRYLENENLVVQASATTEYDGYLYVDLVTHDDKVVHMLWTQDRVGVRAAAGQRFLLGTQGQVFTVVPPFGTEMLMIVSSPVPLIDGARPQIEEVGAYLNDLKAGMDAAARDPSTHPVVSNYHFIHTAASGGLFRRP